MNIFFRKLNRFFSVFITLGFSFFSCTLYDALDKFARNAFAR
jgi:hypothetical protein